MMNVLKYPERETWKTLTLRPQLGQDSLNEQVHGILARVRAGGDEALILLTQELDQVDLNALKVSQSEMDDAQHEISPDLKNAIAVAARNIDTFHATQRKDIVKVETMAGVICWRKEVPIEKIGLYIPGGSAPLFSTVLMLGIPAKLAGCQNVVLCTPPGTNGKINAAILFAAQVTGITQIFKVGGAQAIAAMAYGTETIPAVDKIFGPGNQYVTKAKQLVNQQGFAIDLPAGPSEVLVVADQYANPAFVAADLLAQAEHGPDSQVVLVTKDAMLVAKVVKEIESQLDHLPRQAIARQALNDSLAILFASDQEIMEFVNDYAPEHLIINTKNCETLSEQVRNAGSVFLGPHTPESAGDYASGTNHTLPTNGFAKVYGGVSLESFTKGITFQKISEEGIKVIGPVVEILASAEQLDGHRESISVRLRSLK